MTRTESQVESWDSHDPSLNLQLNNLNYCLLKVSKALGPHFSSFDAIVAQSTQQRYQTYHHMLKLDQFMAVGMSSVHFLHTWLLECDD